MRPLENNTENWKHKPDNCLKCDSMTNWHLCPKCFFEIRESKDDAYRLQWMTILQYVEGEFPKEGFHHEYE